MPQRRAPSSDEIAELARLQRTGRYLDAYERTQNFCRPEEWSDIDAVILAGRLFSCWGDMGRSNRLHQQAWRAAPTHPSAVYFCSLAVEAKHGPLEALKFLRDQRAVAAVPESGVPARYQIWIWLQEARLLATFRDFDAANALARRAGSHATDDPWYWVETARLHEQQDKYAEALVAAEKALELGPNYRPSIETTAHLYMVGNRDDDAVALLGRSLQNLQAANLAEICAVLLMELERYDEALTALDRATEWLPCADRIHRTWLTSRRSDVLRALGRDAEASAQARLVKGGFHDHIAARLGEPNTAARRVRLRVKFVRQHHVTCAPATLAAIGNYWQHPVDHLELARTICYDGTPDHEERHWAESHGWRAREFRVTWDSAVALLDRGCPFTLTTVGSRQAHLQAVVGYDARLGLLQIRDPYERTHGECIGQKFIEGCASHGPRGMILVPPGREALLEGIELPDAGLYDHWYLLRRALLRHDRNAAQAAADALAATAPGHRLSLQAQRELAIYDGNLLRQLEATRALLALFPEESNLLLDEVQLLRTLGHAKERREKVEALGQRRNADPHFLREYCEMLADDARTHPRALRLARRVLRRHAIDAGNLRSFANLLWSLQRFGDATDVYRLAACVGDKMEGHWDSFFIASRHTQRVEECLDLLRQRESRLGPQSSQPIRTLFRACDTLDRTTEAFAALDAAISRRPHDGELLLFAAESHGRYGRRDEAVRCVSSARAGVPRSQWLRTNARLAEFRSDHDEALTHWRELLTLNPVDVPAHGSAATLIATLEGRAAALAFLRASCEQHPKQIGLQNLFLEWLRSEPPGEALSVVDSLLALDPINAWAMREKALILRRAQRSAEALPIAQLARQIEPRSPFSASIEGTVLNSLGREAEARAAFEDALRLAIDCGCMDDLVRTYQDFEGRKAAVAFLQAELARQPAPDAAAFLRFREIARMVLPPADLRSSLELLLAAHPAHWAAWSVLSIHLGEQGEMEAAQSRAEEAVRRFPLVARVWIDLASVQSRANQSDAEITSLQRALELAPTWGYASRALAGAHQRARQLDAAEHVLRRAMASDPLDVINHGVLSDLLWSRERKDDAVAMIERAVTTEPGYETGWQRLDAWSRERNDSRRAIALAETITQSRPGDARAWIRLAQLQLRDPAAALPALERATAIEPRNIDAHDLRAQLLSGMERHDEALAACRPDAFGNPPPHELQGRAAWVCHTRGDVSAAIEQMHALLQKHPDYLWGWSCLTEWCWDAERFPDTAKAASTWSWLAPDSPVPLGYVAAAQQRIGNRRDAKASYWRALQRSPGYGFGAQTLLKLLTEDGEADEATRVLRHIEVHLSPADAQRAAVLYHIMRRDKTAAGSALAALAAAPDEKFFLFDESVRALAEANWHLVTEDALRPLLVKPETKPAVARAWVTAWAGTQRWSKARQLDRTEVPEPLRREGWSAVLEHLGRANAIWRLRWLRWRRREWLRSTAGTWGSVGYALATTRQSRAAIRWMHDWRSRADVAPWMLHNLALAYFNRKDPARALVVVEHALTLRPDGLRAGFLIWRGIERALVDDHVGAAADYAAIPPNADIQDMTFAHAMLRTLVQFEKEIPHSAKDALRQARARIKQQWAETPSAYSDTGLLHLRARVLRHLGRRAGSWVTRAISYFPAPGRRYLTPRVMASVGPYGMALWVAVMVAGMIVRGCSGD